ncbi:RNA binding protein, putative [Leishmania tarentolae]|uniref:RNA binding protein, putative n=1 Tax=Leishmania tarentolae TaxID=5689 RepID=A0A640KKC9_LEITA|nr:RNA binding protein, putative [Leishmania tarentolae]
MPSRAVVRKKQRRDAKRRKAHEGGRTPSQLLAPDTLGTSESAVSLSPSQVQVPRSETKTEPLMPRKRASQLPPTDQPSPTSSASAAPEHLAHPLKRRRGEMSTPEPMPEGLTRKERRRLETSQRLEWQMLRLSSTAKAAREMTEEAAAQQQGTPGDVADGGTVAVSEPQLRHDPKFKHGTFWRDRKEKRARTLFLGGIPSSFSVKQVKDFISTVIDLDPDATEYADQIGENKEVVEEVDMLPVKHHSKVKHMYVTMASVPLAGCAAAALNGYKVEGKELRCNFAADKVQREEAIRRRNAAQR